MSWWRGKLSLVLLYLHLCCVFVPLCVFVSGTLSFDILGVQTSPSLRIPLPWQGIWIWGKQRLIISFAMIIIPLQQWSSQPICQIVLSTRSLMAEMGKVKNSWELLDTEKNIAALSLAGWGAKSVRYKLIQKLVRSTQTTSDTQTQQQSC